MMVKSKGKRAVGSARVVPVVRAAQAFVSPPAPVTATSKGPSPKKPSKSRIKQIAAELADWDERHNKP